MKIKKWKTLTSKVLFDTKFVSFRKDSCQLPDGRVNPSYYVMEFTDWVTVLAITESGKFVLVKQYRYAADEFFCEFPGGASDGEDPLLAAKRELLEETGYEAGSIELVGIHYPNPALQNNKLHTYIARDCKKIAKQNLDDFEEIEVLELDKEEFFKMIKEGNFQHSLMLASLGLALPFLDK